MLTTPEQPSQSAPTRLISLGEFPGGIGDRVFPVTLVMGTIRKRDAPQQV